jgi:mannonate dehydratase
MMELSLVLPPKPDGRWTLATQMGVTNAVVHPLEIGDGTMFWGYDRPQIMCNWFDGAGIDVSVIEGSVPITDKTRLGLPGRDEEIETFKTFLRHVGQLGIPVVAYDWMAGLRWTRTNVHRAARGGSLVTEFDREKMSGGPPPTAADTTAEELFENLRYFLERVVPVAEEADVRLALHPDDEGGVRRGDGAARTDHRAHPARPRGRARGDRRQRDLPR